MIFVNKWMTAAIVFSTIAIVADDAKAEKKYGPGVTDTGISGGRPCLTAARPRRGVRSVAQSSRISG